ncbi:MAG: indolepyruvate oxidoreductase subunit beta [Chloroflexota bacterium]
MSEVKNLLLVGVGGQGTILASKIVASVLAERGFDVKMSEVHGMAQRGGSVVTQVRYGDRVHSPLIEPDQADFILAFERLEAARYRRYLKPGGTVIVNDLALPPLPVLLGQRPYPADVIDLVREKADRVVLIDAAAVATEAGNYRTQNVVLVGALARVLALADLPAWERVVAGLVPPKTIDANIAALRLGYARAGA